MSLRMSGTIIPTILPQSDMSIADPQPYDPEWLNALSDGQRQSPEIKEFSRRMHDSGAERVTWLFWHYQARALWTPVGALSHNGSMFFLDCGRGPFAVTAAHVYEAYLEHVHESQIRGVQVGNVDFDPHERLIASGKRLGLNIDIATFRVTKAEIEATGKKTIQGTDGPWPPPPNKGEVVYFGGFPECERDRIAGRDFSFGLHSAMVPLTSFTQQQLCCQFERSYWMDVRGLGLPPVGYELSGASGGPMLQPVFKDGAWDWRLVGVADLAKVAHDFLRGTGRVVSVKYYISYIFWNDGIVSHIQAFDEINNTNPSNRFGRDRNWDMFAEANTFDPNMPGGYSDVPKRWRHLLNFCD
jgi:hypothetical protein